MSHVFISYSRKDRKVVSQYVESLRKQDFIVWIDVNNIDAGDDWNQALMNAIEQSSAVLVFWSKAASVSDYVNKEIDHAIKHDKLIIPVWLDQDVQLREGLKETQAIINSGFSPAGAQEIGKALIDKAPRIQRQIMAFDTSKSMSDQTIDGIEHKDIGTDQYVIVPLIKSAYSSAHVIAKADTVVRKVPRIQLIIQNTGDVDYTVVRQAFQAVMQSDSEYSDEAEPLVALYVVGARKPSDETEYWVDSTNVAHYSDMSDTTQKAIKQITKDAVDTQTVQLFLKTLVDIAFLLGASIERWIPLVLYKWAGTQYLSVINIPPRIPN